MRRYKCPWPGCFATSETRGRMCPAHAQYQAARDAERAAAATARWERHHAQTDYSWVWHDPRWRKLRAAQLKRAPECNRCGEKATTVDHVVPHRGDLSLAFDAGNLQSLCARCSAIKTREDRETVPNPYPGREKQGGKH